MGTLERRIWAIPLVAFSGVLLCWPALFNGYPFLFPDTGSYLSVGIRLVDTGWLSPSWSRPPFYSLFLLPLHWKYSLWPIVIAQGLISAHLVYLVFRVLGGKVPMTWYMGTIVLLAFGTSLPWHVSTLIPDVFAGVVVLGAFLLCFDSGRLSLVERVYLVFLVAAAISFHFSHFAIGAFVFAIALVLWWWKGRYFGLGWRQPAMVALPLVLALTAMMAVNFVSRGEAAVSTHGSLFVLNKYKDIVREYLEETCAEDSSKYELCGAIDEFNPRPGGLLWGKDSLTREVGPNLLRHEARTLLIDSFLANPTAYLGRAVNGTMRQMVSFKTGAWIYPIEKYMGVDGAVNVLSGFPGEYERYVNSKQHDNSIKTKWFAGFHYFVLGAAIVALVVSYFRGALVGIPSLYGLVYFVLVGVVGNAAFTSAVSGVVHRYQSRIVWLIVVLLILVLAFRGQQNRHSNGSHVSRL